MLPGEHDKAAAHPSHALLLVWPYSAMEAASPWAQGKPAWDAAALGAYTGDVVAHVGDLEAGAVLVTTSPQCKRLLASRFDLESSLELPAWPHCKDRLTIWRRKAALSVA